MSNRREFIKLAGVAGLGICATKLAFMAGEAQAGEAMPTAKDYSRPMTAKRFAMAIDTRRFDDALIKKCVDACHKPHNVPEIPTKQNIKWLFPGNFEETFPTEHNHFLPHEVEHRNFLMLCNHCANPACVRVCPTKATFKRPSDGIVMMDWHRCIGCRYCMAGCPFGARSFNFQDPRPFLKEINPVYPTRVRGVVEKCTFCVERLERGQLPLCVEASEGAIAFGDLEDANSAVRQMLKNNYAIRRKPDAGTDPSVFYII